MSEKDVQSSLEQQGYKVGRIKREGSCYEVYVTDKEGSKRELQVNPQNAKIVAEED